MGLKLFLIKSYRGICNYLLKPVKSQRTHSNRKTKSFLSLLIRKKIKFLIEKSSKKVIKEEIYQKTVTKKDKLKSQTFRSVSKFNKLLKLKP